MKKLFLYLTVLFVIVFLTAFFISRKHYSSKESLKITTEAQADGQLVSNTGAAEAVTEEPINVEKAVADSMLITDDADDEYIIGIKNGQVVVYRNTTDDVYEYTGVDAQIIKGCNSEVYDMLENGIRFDSVEEMFKFLESIAS